jgi:hypothetical protein
MRTRSVGRRVCLGDVARAEYDAGCHCLKLGRVGAVWRHVGRLADQRHA